MIPRVEQYRSTGYKPSRSFSTNDLSSGHISGSSSLPHQSETVALSPPAKQTSNQDIGARNIKQLSTGSHDLIVCKTRSQMTQEMKHGDVRVTPRVLQRRSLSRSSSAGNCQQKNAKPANNRTHDPSDYFNTCVYALLQKNEYPDNLSPATAQKNSTTLGYTHDVADKHPERHAYIPAAAVQLSWNLFQQLETDFEAYQSLSKTKAKVDALKHSLLPFLRETHNCRTTTLLKPHEIHRRSVALSMWWGALLDILLLHEKTNGLILSEWDRPLFMKGALLMMSRSEWRKLSYYSQPLAERSKEERLHLRSKDNFSHLRHNSSHTAMLKELAARKTQAMFSQHLKRHMELAVALMSQESLPLPIDIRFSGMCMAYGFFFVAGMAGLLLHLLEPTYELIQRTSTALRLSPDLSDVDDSIIQQFSPELHLYGWKSSLTLWDALHKAPMLNDKASSILRTGLWAQRWKHPQSPLFLSFYKHYMTLCSEFLPSDISLQERAKAPGFLLLHSQLLVMLDDQVQSSNTPKLTNARASKLDGMGQQPSESRGQNSSTLGKATNISRSILVTLLKDILLKDVSYSPQARNTFAATFALLLRSVAMSIPAGTASAWVALFHLLKPIFIVYDNFGCSNDASAAYIDWNFWFDLLQQKILIMDSSLQSLTVAFIYTTWDLLAKDPARKWAACDRFLLTETTFNALFISPFTDTRTHYQHLFCWKICRDVCAMQPHLVDISIFAKAAKLLSKVWQYHLYIEEDSAKAPKESLELNPPTFARTVRFAVVQKSSNASYTQRNCSNIASNELIQRIPATSQDTNINLGNTVRTARRQSFARKMLSLFNATADIPPPLPFHHSANDVKNKTNCHAARLQKQRQSSEVELKDQLKKQSKLLTTSTQSEPQATYVFVKKRYSELMIKSGGNTLMPPELPGPAQMRVTGPKSRVLQMRLLANAHFVPQSFFAGSLSADPAIRDLSLQIYNPQQSPDDDDIWRPLLQDCPLRRANAMSKNIRASISSPDELPQSTDLLTGNFKSTGHDLNGSHIQTILLEPKKPKSPFSKNAIYFKPALLEWSNIIEEHRNYITQRYEEGVMTIGALEVPTLYF